MKLREVISPVAWLERVSNRIYEANVRLRLEALGMQRSEAQRIIDAYVDEGRITDPERIVKIVTYLVAMGYAQPGMADQPGLTARDVAVALAFCLASDGGAGLRAHCAPADFETEHLDRWTTPSPQG